MKERLIYNETVAPFSHPHPTLNQLEKFQFEVSAVVKTGDNVGFHDVIYEGRGGKKKFSPAPRP